MSKTKNQKKRDFKGKMFSMIIQPQDKAMFKEFAERKFNYSLSKFFQESAKAVMANPDLLNPTKTVNISADIKKIDRKIDDFYDYIKKQKDNPFFVYGPPAKATDLSVFKKVLKDD